MKIIAIAVCLFCITSCNPKQQYSEIPELRNETDSLSYYLGVYTGLTLRDAGYTVFENKVFDSTFLSNLYAPTVSEADYIRADTVIAAYIRNGRLKRSLTVSRKFLTDNKKRRQVQITPTGLQYEVIRDGNGPYAALGDSVKMFFTGTTIDGVTFMKFDSIPLSILLNNGTPGGIEAIQMMQAGARYKFYLSPELGYGVDPLPGSNIKPNMVLIYSIEILSILKNRQ